MSPRRDFDPSVAVVGNGAAGALVVLGLLRTAARRNTSLRVSWIGADQPCRGTAYSTPRPWHRLNVPAANMSVDDSHHFEEWLAARSADRDAFAARWEFGSYLQHVLNQAHRYAGDLVELTEFRDRAVGLSTTSDGVRIVLDSGEVVAATRAVLALGVFPPAPLPELTPAATTRPLRNNGAKSGGRTECGCIDAGQRRVSGMCSPVMR